MTIIEGLNKHEIQLERVEFIINVLIGMVHDLRLCSPWNDDAEAVLTNVLVAIERFEVDMPIRDENESSKGLDAKEGLKGFPK